MDCKRVSEVVFLVVDNEIEQELLTELREHLALCPPCAQQLSYTRKLIAVVRARCQRAVAPARLRVRILTSFPHRAIAPGEPFE